MALTSETFAFAYELNGTRNTGYTLEDAIPSTKIVDPVRGNITVVDPSGPGVSLDQPVTIQGAPVGSNFIFIAQADIKDHGDKLNGIIVEDTTTGKSYFLTDDQYTGKLGGKNGDVKITSYESTICFLAGTMVRTSEGEVPVETLKRGDLVLTSDGRSIPVDWLGIQTVSLRFADKLRVLPIRIRAGALADNVPSRPACLPRSCAVG